MVTSALFWFYILFCIVIIVFAALHHQLVERMQSTDEMKSQFLSNKFSYWKQGCEKNYRRAYWRIILSCST
jgi:hypothetical protein